MYHCAGHLITVEVLTLNDLGSGGASLRSRLTQSDGNVHIDPRVTGSVEVAKAATHKTYKVAAYTVDKVRSCCLPSRPVVSSDALRFFGWRGRRQRQLPRWSLQPSVVLLTKAAMV